MARDQPDQGETQSRKEGQPVQKRRVNRTQESAVKDRVRKLRKFAKSVRLKRPFRADEMLDRSGKSQIGRENSRRMGVKRSIGRIRRANRPGCFSFLFFLSSVSHELQVGNLAKRVGLLSKRNNVTLLQTTKLLRDTSRVQNTIDAYLFPSSGSRFSSLESSSSTALSSTMTTSSTVLSSMMSSSSTVLSSTISSSS